MVEMESGRCLQTSSDVRPGKVAKYPAPISFVHVMAAGLKATQCIYWTRSRLVVME